MWPTFEPGSPIVVTEEWHERLWAASPHRVVESGLDGLVMYQPAGTTSVVTSNIDLAYTEGMSRSERKLAALETLRTEPRSVSESPTKLYFYSPASWARVNLGWDPLDGHFMGWYVNFERPARRTAEGLVSKDLLLDIYVWPDHSWAWKDKDEFAEAIDRQIIDPNLRDLLEVEAERVLARMAAGEGRVRSPMADLSRPGSLGNARVATAVLGDGIRLDQAPGIREGAIPSRMDWPLQLPARLAIGDVTIACYRRSDAAALFAAIDDLRSWEHIPYEIPTDWAELDAAIRQRLSTGNRLTFTIRDRRRVVGTTSLTFDPAEPNGVEIGGTQLSPDVWGTGLNGAVKALLIQTVFDAGADWIQLRTDERNLRSAAAIRKLGAEDLGVRDDTYVRRDGTVRRSRFFRLAPPGR